MSMIGAVLKRMTLAMGVAFATFAVCAADRTWSGAGTDNGWSIGANWGGTAPVAGDTLFFGGSSRTSNSNDISDGLAISGIGFNLGAGAFALGGSGITLNGNISNFSANAQTLNLPMTLTGIRTIYGSNTDFTVNGVLSGPGGLYLDSTNKTFTIKGNNSYEGLTSVTNCRLWITHANALGSTNQGTVIWGRQNGNLTLSGNIEIAEPLTIKGQILPWISSLTCNSGSNVITGPVYKEIDGRMRVEAGNNKLIFRGGLIHVNGGQTALNPATGAEMIFLDKPISFGTSASILTEEGGTVVLGVAGNTFSQLQIGNQSKVRLEASNAIPSFCTLVIGASWAQNGLLNMNGFDATVALLRTDAHATNPGYLAVTSAVPATLTVNQGSGSTYAGALAGAVRFVKNSGGTITFTNAFSTTSGEIVLNGGSIILAENAGFTNSASIRINGGTFEIRNGASLSDAATVRILDGAKFKIKAGVTETVDKLFLDGEQQISGTWGATGSGAANVNDAFFTGGGVLNVVSGTLVPYADALWDGGGADTNLSTEANWSGDALPSFEGYARAIFAAGGAQATVDTPASFSKMIFNANTNFTVAAGAGVITNGAGGIKAGVPNTTSRTYTLAEDIVLGDSQFWSITNSGAGYTTLNVTGAISDGSQAYSLTKRGNGILVLAGNSSYTGKTTLQTNGYIVIKHANALGSVSGITEIENGGYIRIDGPVGGGFTIPEPITMTGDEALGWGGTLRSYSGSNIWTGKITSNGARLRCESGACFEIQGGVDGSSLVCSAYGSRWIRFTEKPITAGALTSHTSDGGVIIAVAGNLFTSFNACGYFVRIDVPNAWPPNCSLTQGDGGNGASQLNLNGNSQTVGLWQTQRDNSEPRILFSVAPATLTVNQSANTLFNGSVTGAVSIVKLGTGNLTLTNAFITTSGSFAVSNGTLTVSNKGTFGPNSTNIFVGGTGTLLLSNSVAIADAAAVRMPAAGTATAKINLAPGVNETVSWLFYGGVYMRAGTYGSSGSGAVFKDDTHFSGAGILRVLKDRSGTLMSLL